ncbi:MAG TPA: hypothetical protein PKY59_06545 [Pyrinomonadaceae bacterium]|nr:hypothetical protein [Pyrinomonadaceae bacterium]
MNKLTIKLFFLMLLAVCGTTSAIACEGLPEEVSTLMGEMEQGGLKTDCTVNQIMTWAAKNRGANALNDATKMMLALGYEYAPNFQIYTQSQFDTMRKKENGVSNFFSAIKGNSATIFYDSAKKEYTLIQFREFPRKETSSFNIKITYAEGSRFSAEDKKKIEEAANWWKERILDKFEITLEFGLDPSISAGGTTLVGNVPRSCIDHQPGYAEITLKEVNTSLVSHEIGHALGIGTASIFKKDNVCSLLSIASKDVHDLNVRNARMENGKFFGEISKGVLMVNDRDGDYGHVSSEVKDDDGNASAVQPGLGGKPSLVDLRILEDLGYEIQ